LFLIDFEGAVADYVRTTNESAIRFRDMYFRKKTSGGFAYLQIVESRRQGAQVRQQVIATLGRVEDLRESGQLERLLRSGARFAAKAIVVDAGAVTASAARRIGPALVFERLWEETGCRRVVGRRGPRWFAQARLPARTRGVSHRSASSIFRRLRSSGGPLAGGLPHRWGREPRPASPLPGDGLAWRRRSTRPSRRVA
jgi:hypothetical protein